MHARINTESCAVGGRVGKGLMLGFGTSFVLRGVVGKTHGASEIINTNSSIYPYNCSAFDSREIYVACSPHTCKGTLSQHIRAPCVTWLYLVRLTGFGLPNEFCVARTELIAGAVRGEFDRSSVAELEL